LSFGILFNFLIKQVYGGAITVTGGTESGHTSAAYSHANGYKFDPRLESGHGSFIQNHFRYEGKNSRFSEIYISPFGTQYGLEGDHWNVLVR
jgi:hypothetical protein